MRFALAIHGTRGDVEPCTAVGLELQKRGHDVRMAVPPNLLDFVIAAGIHSAVAYGPDSQKQLEGNVFERPDALTAASPRDWLKLGNPLKALRKAREAATDRWADSAETLHAIADGADLLVSGTAYQEIAVNVAERHRIPLAELHYFPVRPNHQTFPAKMPEPLLNLAWSAGEWFHWRLLKPADDQQRRALGLPPTGTPPVRRIIESGALEIQAYDKVFFPALAEEWADNRPMVGSLTLQLPSETDDDLMTWITAGNAPIYFGFGSMPIQDPHGTLQMVSAVCADMGHRALICSGTSNFNDLPTADHVKVVAAAHHATVFSKCRAVVHHGGAGTTAAGVRAGVPTLVLWVAAEQPLWGRQITRLGIGRSRRFTKTTAESLRADLDVVLSEETARRAHEVSALMTPPAVSVANTCDLLEKHCRTPSKA